MHIYARHGDIVIVAEPIPPDATLRTRQGLIVAGQRSHAHTINGEVEATEVSTTGDRLLCRVRVTDATQIAHGETHDVIPLTPQDYAFYALRDLRGNVED